jgi:hypothetical protein
MLVRSHDWQLKFFFFFFAVGILLVQCYVCQKQNLTFWKQTVGRPKSSDVTKI